MEIKKKKTVIRAIFLLALWASIGFMERRDTYKLWISKSPKRTMWFGWSMILTYDYVMIVYYIKKWTHNERF